MNIANLLGSLDSGATQSGKANGLGTGLLGGVAGGALTSALLSKKGRKHLGSIAKLGGVAALGGLAWKAYSEYSKGNHAPENTVQQRQDQAWQDLQAEEFRPGSETTYAAERNLLLIRAMIAAAHADGTLDDDERQRIFGQVETMDLPGSLRHQVIEELSQPRSLREIASRVDDNETAIEVYLISLMTIDTDCGQGASYLNALAFILELPGPLVQQLHSQLHAGELAVSAA